MRGVNTGGESGRPIIRNEWRCGVSRIVTMYDHEEPPPCTRACTFFCGGECHDPIFRTVRDLWRCFRWTILTGRVRASVWCVHDPGWKYPFELGRSTRLSLGHLSLIVDLTLKKGLGHPCTNWSGTGAVPLMSPRQGETSLRWPVWRRLARCCEINAERRTVF